MLKLIKQIFDNTRIYFSGKLTAKKFIPGIAWFFILFILLCIPGRDLPQANDWMKKIYFDKWVHAGLFGLLAVLFMGPILAADFAEKKKWKYILFILFAVSFWGVTTEFIQHNFVEGRTFDLFDWLADTCGAIIAIFFSKYFFWNKEPYFPVN